MFTVVTVWDFGFRALSVEGHEALKFVLGFCAVL